MQSSFRATNAAADVALITRVRGTATHGQNVLLYNQHIPNRHALFMPELHAKLYVAIGKVRDYFICLLGSANLSEASIGRNLETSLFLEPPYSPAEMAYIDKMHQLGDHILRRARKQTYK